tara:strand:- start:204 stop:572 length:369 start_codon:yes stop_codon:yes gene_type:complete
MVKKLNYLRHRGVLEWVIQRVSAVLLAIYSVGIISFLITHPNLDFESWNALHETQSVRVFSLLTLLGLCAHMWIGMWTIITDYLTPLHLGASANTAKGLCQIGIITLIILYAIWGTFVIWSI